MDEHYGVLGLSPGADLSQIKRAYFRLVREHSPEKDPDGFRRIREAYEALQNPKYERNEISFPQSSNRMSEWMWEQINIALLQKNGKLARDLAEDAITQFEDEDRFLYVAAVTNRRLGNSGKAVKASKKLVERNPDNCWYQSEYALDCYDRGFFKKAYPAFLKAISLGNKEREFRNLAAQTCDAVGNDDRALSLLLELMRETDRADAETVYEVMDIFFGIIHIGLEKHSGSNLVLLDEALCHMDKLLKTSGRYFEGITELVIRAADMFEKAYFRSTGKKTEYYAEIMNSLLKLEYRDKERCRYIESLKASVYEMNPMDDDRLSWYMRELLSGGNPLWDADTSRFYRLCMQLCLLEDPRGALKEAELIEKEYPGQFERIGKFAAELRRSNDPEAMRKEYLRRHDRMLFDFNGSWYYDEFPEREREKTADKDVFYSSENSVPYERGAVKIGRNDPCPCGSGKKYKKCCMNRQ